MTDSSSRDVAPVVVNIGELAEMPINRNPGHAHDEGWIRRVANVDLNGSPDLIVSILRMEPNQYHPLHLHPDLGELYFVLSGHCELQLGETIHRVEAGTAIYTPKGVPHSLRTLDEGVEVLIVFPEGDLSKVRKEWVGP